MTPCTGPACDRPAVARGYCASHLRQVQRGRPLTPLRSGPALERVSIRVSPGCRERVLSEPGAARETLERWAKRQR